MSGEPNMEDLKSKVSFGIKFWLTFENKSILGSGWHKLLEFIENNEGGSLTEAAEELGYSYKYAWNILKRIEKRTGRSPVETKKGGHGGGGSVKLTNWGKYLHERFTELDKEITKVNKKLRQKNT
ncbi:MAG: ModE family transcriptional regulator (modular protein) [Promethearchaeota archaeon]|nr:MAG: ModE family transcriptional regulator (modular protein) [Candidatus Lokiarchaeota archaeon]